MKRVIVFREDVSMEPARMAFFNRFNYESQHALEADVQGYIDLLNGCGYDYSVRIQITDIGGNVDEDNTNSNS